MICIHCLEVLFHVTCYDECVVKTSNRFIRFDELYGGAADVVLLVSHLSHSIADESKGKKRKKRGEITFICELFRNQSIYLFVNIVLSPNSEKWKQFECKWYICPSEKIIIVWNATLLSLFIACLICIIYIVCLWWHLVNDMNVSDEAWIAWTHYTSAYSFIELLHSYSI